MVSGENEMIANYLADILIPMSVFLIMFTVGTGMSLPKLKKSQGYFRTIVVCVSTQLVLLPLATIVLIQVLKPDPILTVGLLVLSLCPSGALSNFYVYLGRGNVELSIFLTIIGSMVYVILFPVVATIAFSFLPDLENGLTFPAGAIAVQLTFLVLFPAALGVGVKHYRATKVDDVRPFLDRTSNVLLVLMILLSTWVGREFLTSSLFEIVKYSVLYAMISLGIGILFARLVRPVHRSTFAIECAVRNLPIALMIVQHFIDVSQVTGLFVGYFLVHAPIALLFSGYMRCKIPS